MMIRSQSLLGLALLMVAAVASAAPVVPAPIINTNARDTIPGQYIVVFHEAVAFSDFRAAEATVRRLGGKIEFRYTSALIGFGVQMPAAGVEGLRTLPGVAWIEADQRVSIDVEQSNPPMGLDRTSERYLPVNNEYTYSETGQGVSAYVLDTGILDSHQEFNGGRAKTAPFFDAFGGIGLDCHGHGTHVAGTIGGKTYGIAKNVEFYRVRVLDCGGSGSWSGVIAGIDWVAANALHPAVANMSLGGGVSPAVDLAVTNSIASGVTYVVAAGNSGQDACNFSPARVPNAITVGAIDPTNDTKPAFSNLGPCLDLFAPGVGILSAWYTSNTATNTIPGTSMAAPHVAGVAALYLEEHPAESPANVWGGFHGILYNADVSTTPGWPGIVDPGPGSPNVLLHWGSLNDGFDDGDPHITTVDGVRYDFQSAGEFVALKDLDGLEIQTRQTPVSTASVVGPNAHTGLTTCVSLNTAVAARVGAHRVSFQPDARGPAAGAGGPRLRVDGVVTTLGPNGLDLGGGRVSPSLEGGIRIDFPNETVLTVTPFLWGSQNTWFLNLAVFRTPATDGIMGAMAPGSWLPALPDGSSLGAKPASLHQRYVDLYQKFADAWRVSNSTSLFDYAAGTSTATFTFSDWPRENPPCVVPNRPPVRPVSPQTARRHCSPVAGKERNADCVFDVTVTGEPGFAKAYQLSERIQAGSTAVDIAVDPEQSRPGEPVAFTAIVSALSRSDVAPVGFVRFLLDGSPVGEPFRLDSAGRATWTASRLEVGSHRVAASFSPQGRTVYLSSTSREKTHQVLPVGGDCIKTEVVSGMHYPDKTCSQSAEKFRAEMLSNSHLTSRCPREAPLASVFDISCQDAPIPGFPTGSVYQATVCCARP